MSDSDPRAGDKPMDATTAFDQLPKDARSERVAASGEVPIRAPTTSSKPLGRCVENCCEEDANSRLLTTELLLEEHHDAVYRYAYRLCGCTAAAEDISQEVFIRAFRNIHQLREHRAARSWLLVIARREFVRWCKRFGGATVEPRESDARSNVVRDCEAVDREEWLQRALMELPEDFRIALSMFYFEHLTYAEMAEQLDVPLGTVMSRLNRGRGHLKKALQRMSEPRSSTSSDSQQ